MQRFKRSFNGYDVNEVNAFFDRVIKHVESIVKEETRIKEEIIKKDNKILELENELRRYKIIEEDLQNSLKNAQENSEYIKRVAKSEGSAIINEARTNANRIVSDALIRAERVENESLELKKNIKVFKSKVRLMLNEQLDILDEFKEDI